MSEPTLFRLSPIVHNLCEDCLAFHPDDTRIFEHCWGCGVWLGFVMQKGDEWPECDACVLRKGRLHVWCPCKDGPNDAVLRFSYCHYNHAFWGRWDFVVERRALPA